MYYTICSCPTYESSLVSVHNGMSDNLRDIQNAKPLTMDCTRGGKGTEILYTRKSAITHQKKSL